MSKSAKRRILILGDSCRGKSTFAEKLSEKIGVPWYSTDDFFYRVKFSEVNDKQRSIEEIRPIYDREEWIVEGTTRHLIQAGLEKAEVIYLLEFKSLLSQYWALIRRHFTRDNETLAGLWGLLRHATYKKYKKGYGSHLPSLREMLQPYQEKTVRLGSLAEIRAELGRAR